jgi:protein SCO1/2
MSARPTAILASAALAILSAAWPAPRAPLLPPRDDKPPLPPAILREVGFDQKLGAMLPPDGKFRDEEGHPVTLAEVGRGKPIVLALVYYRCPMLCTLVLNGVVRCLRTLSFDAGREFEVVAVSIDPNETPELAAAKKKQYVASYDRAGTDAGWHFLTGDAASIRALADAVGFRYTFDAASGQFAHASGILVATPAGVVSHYFLGIEYFPREVRLALVEAAEGKIGGLVDQVLLLCFQYDPTTGRYGLAILRILRVAAIATVIAVLAYVGFHLRRERRRAASSARASANLPETS